MDHKQSIDSFLSAYGAHIIVAVIMLFVLYVLITIFPLEKSPLSGMKNEEIIKILKEDKQLTLYLDNKLDNNLKQAQNKDLFSRDFDDMTAKQKESLEKFWISYLKGLIELDMLKNRYKTFYQINVLTRKEMHKKAFFNGYTALLAQHHYTLELVKRIEGKDKIITFLNEEHSDYGIKQETYGMVRQKLTSESGIIRLNAGRSYRAVWGEKDKEQDKLIKKYLKNIDNSLKDYSYEFSQRPLRSLEKNSFKLWFPVQKTAAKNISYIRTTTRDYHIKPQFINKFRERFLPGDILLERREWHATNVGIPGYWTHSALYLGTLQEMNDYYKGLPQLKGESVEYFLKKNYPEAYKKLKEPDENGYKRAVIESKRPGVILMSLEDSANADSLGVLRVRNLTRSERFEIMTRALDNLGKPYDFNFDFVTDSSLVCSELVYKAYQNTNKLNLDLKEMNGRLIYSPNDFTEKYFQEFEREGQELELVLFLDGNEKKGVAVEKDEKVFKNTWKRPKWHIANDFFNFR